MPNFFMKMTGISIGIKVSGILWNFLGNARKSRKIAVISRKITGIHRKITRNSKKIHGISWNFLGTAIKIKENSRKIRGISLEMPENPGK